MNKKTLIVMEGACDGIGKTTQYQKLKEHLEQENKTVITHHFPSYQTYQGALVEQYLRGAFGNPSDLSPYFINSLYAIDRAVTWKTTLEQSYNQGKVILLDRYTTSSLIYQSALIEDKTTKKNFIDDICDFEYNKINIPKPNIVIFLYAPFELVTKLRNERKQNEGVKMDIHESNLDFMKKVYANALWLSEYLNWDRITCNKKDNMKSIDEIHQDIYQLIKKKVKRNEYERF